MDPKAPQVPRCRVSLSQVSDPLSFAPWSEGERLTVQDDPQPIVVDEDNVVRERPIEVLRTQSDRVIVGEGLRAGERVALGPSGVLVDGMTVRPLDVDAQPRTSKEANP